MGARAYDSVEGTKLFPLVNALAASWRAAANTHVMPWAMIQGMHGFWEGVKDHGYTPLFVSKMGEGIPKRMTGTPMTRMAIRRLKAAIDDFAAEVHDVWAKEADDEIKPEAIWAYHLDNYEFSIAVWGSQQLVFGALFFAYENFVTDLIILANEGRTDFKPPRNFGAIVATAKELFDPIDPTIVATCLQDDFVTITRLARNCLAHNGGKESDDLKKLGHGLEVIDGVINIMAPDNAIAMQGLTRRVSLLIEAALKLPQFASTLDGIVDLADRLYTFDDSANYLAGLDLLVTVDTAIAHLAGAMGKRVFLALPFMPDWRWGLGSSESPWYPTIKLFRQSKPKEWGPVFAAMSQEVKRLSECPR